ncbi:tripartite tricarboxylate transporter substrate binding protein [Variovorax sp. EBFNA2]|uniref:Bug family tripartite tricarboxylate transporter substrate binding protein n=1 Tax=Variovorax sp. EBFNA2 TaxID=3342097 RepID=UPI0029C05564|nr:tripartite tricarboxylate transporter substrate binding protein [Variovorax boronicumulans]WPG41192.1 tripartite tricarboxylate transporter substrate binding protein [Variovorax boronicumulans]
MNQHHALQRRKFVAGALGSAMLGSAWGSSYPDKPIKMVLPVSPGSAIDATARRLGPVLEGALGQPLVVENRPGSAGLIATAQLVRSPADGYTLAIVASTHCITPHLYKASFHPLRDVQPVLALTSGPMIFVVHSSVPAKDVQQLISYARSRPEKQSVTLGNSGNGTPLHVAGALMSLKGGFKALHVAYKGIGAFSTDLAGGQVMAGFLPVIAAAPLIKSGRIRALGISTLKRLPVLPDVPTLAESGLPGFDVDGWLALIAPKGTPSVVVQRLNGEFNTALHTPELELFVGDSGGAVIGGTVNDCESLFQRDFAGYGRLIAQAGIKAD